MWGALSNVKVEISSAGQNTLINADSRWVQWICHIHWAETKPTMLVQASHSDTMWFRTYSCCFGMQQWTFIARLNIGTGIIHRSCWRKIRVQNLESFGAHLSCMQFSSFQTNTKDGIFWHCQLLLGFVFPFHSFAGLWWHWLHSGVGADKQNKQKHKRKSEKSRRSDSKCPIPKFPISKKNSIVWTLGLKMIQCLRRELRN